MGLDLAQVAANEAAVTVNFMGQTAKVKYRPNVITQDALETTTEDEGFVAFFASVVVSWDVTVGKKKVLLDPKSLKGVPLVFLRAVFMAIMEDGGQGEADAPSSAG